jgi:hypothetical protein
MKFTLHALRGSTLIRFIATVLLLTLAACSQSSDSGKPPLTRTRHARSCPSATACFTKRPMGFLN